MTRPTIHYPCVWPYTVIAAEKDTVVPMLREVLAPLDYGLAEARESRNGRYVSIHVTVSVASEEERDRVFVALRDLRAVRLVL